MMANFVQNDISPLIFFFFWQPVYYFLDADEQSFSGKSKEMRAWWDGVDDNIGTNMCWKLVDNNSGDVINQSNIRSAIEPGSANLQVDPLELLPNTVDDDTDVLDELSPWLISKRLFLILHH